MIPRAFIKHLFFLVFPCKLMEGMGCFQMALWYYSIYLKGREEEVIHSQVEMATMARVGSG